MKELKRTYLVQSLSRSKKFLINPFSFGGGLKNGGLSNKLINFISPLFSFDHIKAAEFEFGIVSKFFHIVMYNIKEYSLEEFIINKAPLYIICNSDKRDLINKKVIELSNSAIQYKRETNLDIVLGLNNNYRKEDYDTIGWIELNNNFMIFLEKVKVDQVIKGLDINITS